jgi:putative endopeptidase
LLEVSGLNTISLSRVWATLLIIGICVWAAGCGTPSPTLKSGIDVAGMDKSVAPGEDFNAYANGGWMKATPIPADKAEVGNWDNLQDSIREHLRTLIEQPNADSKAAPEAQKAADFYASYMDEAAIAAKGTSPLKTELDTIAAIKSRQDLARAIGARLRADVDPLNSTNFETGNLFGVWVAQGIEDPSHYYPYLLQGGLGMPDRDYYVAATPQMVDMRNQYLTHVGAMMRLAGFSDSEARASRVFALETKMAGVHATRVESADVHNAVSWRREELGVKAPGLDWAALLDAAGLKDAPAFMIWHPTAVTGLSALVAKEPVETWKDWLALHLVEDSANFLPKAFVEERFQFRGKALNGISSMRPRWKRGVDFTSEALGEALGKVYSERYFPAASKAKVQGLVNDLTKAFAKRIDALSWMSPETKAKAQRKLQTLKVGVGYPDRWADYSGLSVIKGDAFGNEERADLFRYHMQLAKLHQNVDRGEWWMTPQTVNAVNLPLQNALNFPSAYLQPPYFDPQADAAYNYGAVGATIGHEISHSFDDQGSQFDAEGRMANWWTKADFDHFKAASEALAAQYDGYRPFPDLGVNGHQTLSENIADLAGLLAAYDAYRLSLQGKPDTVKDGMTGDQRFFLSYAQSFRSKAREAALRLQITTDGHAPDQYRVATVRNVDAWYDAFSVSSGQKLFLTPAQRVRVW